VWTQQRLRLSCCHPHRPLLLLLLLHGGPCCALGWLLVALQLWQWVALLPATVLLLRLPCSTARCAG
jgi:hypothetical protein